MFGSTIKSEGDHDRFRSKADRVNVITRMTREERMAKVDEKHGVDRDKDSDDDLDSDWSDSSDDDSSDEYSDSDPDASRSGTDDDSSSASAKGSIKEETPAQKKKRLKKEARKRRLANRPTYRDRFDAWREKRAKERRHPTLVYYEKLMRKEQRKADRLAQEAEDDRIEKEALQREEWAKRKEDEEFLQYVRDEDERRYRRVKAQRQKEMENTMCRMTLFEKWDLENGVINRRLKAEADEKDRCGGGVLCFSSIDGSTPVLRRRRRPDVAAMACRGEGVAGARGTPSTHHQTRRRDREADAKLADDTFRAAKAHNAELLRLEQEHDTQTALTTMRRAGMIAGVNPPRPDAREPPNETDVEILLRVKEKRPEDEEEEEVREPEQTSSRGARRAAIQKHRTKKKKQEESHFEIELKRFRTVEKIQGFKLGPIGVRYLVRDLVLGACPRLDTLDLGWNHIGRQGIKFLSDGFKRKCAPNLSRLDLRANLLMPNSIELLVEGLVKGQVKLKVLDLRANAFKDDGGCLIASLALEGCFETLEELHLESCEIRSRGMWALFQAFQAEARGKLFPSLQHVGLRHNRAAPETLRRMKNCPPWIAF